MGIPWRFTTRRRLIDVRTPEHQKIKVLLDFFCEGHPPPVCLRCSPGLFRHSRGAVSCHTSSMAANPHLALTKNSSPITLANGRRVAQNRGVQGQSPGRPPQRAKLPLAAASETPAPRTARNPQSSIAPSADGAIPAAYAARPPSPPRQRVVDGGLMSCRVR